MRVVTISPVLTSITYDEAVVKDTMHFVWSVFMNSMLVGVP